MNTTHKICPICNQELFGGIASHLLKDKIHRDFFEEQKRIALSCCGKMTAKEAKERNNLFIDEKTIEKYWSMDFYHGKVQCPICGKKILRMGSHFMQDEVHKEFVQKELDIVYKHYGEMSINEIIKKYNLFLNRIFIERRLVKKFSKEYVCKVAHKLTAIKNVGHIPWNTGYTKETHPSVTLISQKCIGRQSPIKGKSFEEFHGIEKARVLKEGIGNFRRGKTFIELYGEERAKEKIEKISGVNSYNWLGGKSFEPYGLDFNKKFKEAIRGRDKYGCLLCNIFEEDHIKLYRKRLSIHHIDYDKKNTFPQNCCTLCNRCNFLVNKDRELWTKHFQGLLHKLYGYEYTQDQKIILDFTGEK